MCSIFLCDAGVAGLPWTQGSMMIFFPAGVSIRKVECPSHVSLMPFSFVRRYSSVISMFHQVDAKRTVTTLPVS